MKPRKQLVFADLAILLASQFTLSASNIGFYLALRWFVGATLEQTVGYRPADPQTRLWKRTIIKTTLEPLSVSR